MAINVSFPLPPEVLKSGKRGRKMGGEGANMGGILEKT
jgi:hypothetical protein